MIDVEGGTAVDIEIDAVFFTAVDAACGAVVCVVGGGVVDITRN